MRTKAIFVKEDEEKGEFQVLDGQTFVFALLLTEFEEQYKDVVMDYYGANTFAAVQVPVEVVKPLANKTWAQVHAYFAGANERQVGRIQSQEEAIAQQVVARARVLKEVAKKDATIWNKVFEEFYELRQRNYALDTRNNKATETQGARPVAKRAYPLSREESAFAEKQIQSWLSNFTMVPKCRLTNRAVTV